MTSGSVAPLAPARLRNHAERAVLLAAFHHRDERLERAAPTAGRAVILTSGASPVSSTGRPLAPDAVDQLGDTGDGGRAEHEIDGGRPALDGVLVELRHAAHDADDEIRPLGLEQAQLAELREHLVLGLLADGAGVDEDEVGLGLVGGQLLAVLAQETGDPLGVILVHLTAVRDQMELGHSCLENPAFALNLDRSIRPSGKSNHRGALDCGIVRPGAFGGLEVDHGP